MTEKKMPLQGASGAVVSDSLAALDAACGGNVLADGPFQAGRLRMMQREDSIYLAGRIKDGEPLEGGDFFGRDRGKTQKELEDLRSALLQRQREEAELYRDIFRVCLVLEMKSPGTPDEAFGSFPETIVRPESAASSASLLMPAPASSPPVIALPEDLEPSLAAYSDFVAQEGPVRRSSDSTLFFSGRSALYTSGDAACGETGADGEPTWIHVAVAEEPVEVSEEMVFPRKAWQSARFPGRAERGKGVRKKHAGPDKKSGKEGGKGLRGFLVRLLKMVLVGGLVGFGYLLLTRYL